MSLYFEFLNFILYGGSDDQTAGRPASRMESYFYAMSGPKFSVEFDWSLVAGSGLAIDGKKNLYNVQIVNFQKSGVKIC